VIEVGQEGGVALPFTGGGRLREVETSRDGKHSERWGKSRDSETGRKKVKSNNLDALEADNKTSSHEGSSDGSDERRRRAIKAFFHEEQRERRDVGKRSRVLDRAASTL